MALFQIDDVYNLINVIFIFQKILLLPLRHLQTLLYFYTNTQNRLFHSLSSTHTHSSHTSLKPFNHLSSDLTSGHRQREVKRTVGPLNVFIHYGECLDRGGGAQFQKLCGADKSWPARLRNPLKGTSGVGEPEGLYFMCVSCMRVEIPEVTFIHLFICGRRFTFFKLMWIQNERCSSLTLNWQSGSYWKWMLSTNLT